MELEGLYRAVVEHSTDGVWVFDLEGRTVHGNAAIASLFGTGQDEFCRLTYFDCLDEGGRAQFADHLVDLRAGRRTPGDVEVQYVRPDGTTFWGLVSETLLPAADEHGALVLHQVAGYDDRRQVFDELALSRRQLAEGQAIARIGTWEWDLGSDRICGSDGLAALFRLDDDYFPTDYASVLESVHPDDRAAVAAAVDEALHGGDGFVFEARFDVEDTWLWVRGRGIVDRAPDGRPRTVTGTFQDINEAKQAQVALEDQVVQNQLLQAIASAANEAGTLHDVLAQARQLVLLHDDWSRAGRSCRASTSSARSWTSSPSTSPTTTRPTTTPRRR